jgi:hypothetical protein
MDIRFFSFLWTTILAALFWTIFALGFVGGGVFVKMFWFFRADPSRREAAKRETIRFWKTVWPIIPIVVVCRVFFVAWAVQKDNWKIEEALSRKDTIYGQIKDGQLIRGRFLAKPDDPTNIWRLDEWTEKTIEVMDKAKIRSFDKDRFRKASTDNDEVSRIPKRWQSAFMNLLGRLSRLEELFW